MMFEPISGDRHLLIDDRILDWVASRISRMTDASHWHDRATGIGIVSGGRILAGVVFHDCDAFNVQLSMAADDPRWATKATIRKLLAYPFDQLGLLRVTTVTAASNERALRFNEGIGFKKEGIMRRGFGDEDAVICGLLKDDAPAWMGFTKQAEIA